MKVLRKFTPSELYTGMIVSHLDNHSYIYEIKLNLDRVDYKPIAKVKYSTYGIKIEKMEVDFWHDGNAHQWCETIQSRELNIQKRREDRLNELGI